MHALVRVAGSDPRLSVAGVAVLFSVYIILVGAKSVARATAERLRGGQCLEADRGSNARATPPRRVPREKSVSSSQMH